MRRLALVAVALALAAPAWSQSLSYTAGASLTTATPVNAATATYGQVTFAAVPVAGEWFQYVDGVNGTVRFTFVVGDPVANNDVKIADTVANQAAYLGQAIQCSEVGKDVNYKCTNTSTLYTVLVGSDYTRLTPMGSGAAYNQTFTFQADNDDEFAVVQSPSGGVTATACAAGMMRYDASYVYVCTATNVWKRAALSSYP